MPLPMRDDPRFAEFQRLQEEEAKKTPEERQRERQREEEQRQAMHAVLYAPLWALDMAVGQAEWLVEEAAKPWGPHPVTGRAYDPDEVPLPDAEAFPGAPAEDTEEEARLQRELDLAEAEARLAGIRAYRNAVASFRRLDRVVGLLSRGWVDAEIAAGGDEEGAPR